MSISLLLIPLAIAGAAAAQAAITRRDTKGQITCEVRTRMRDVALLGAALQETGAVTQTTADTVVSKWDGLTARFDRGEDGVWSAHFTGDVDQDRAIQIIGSVDAEYGRQVQKSVLARLRERAPSAGLRLESESVTADAEVQLIFTVERQL